MSVTGLCALYSSNLLKQQSLGKHVNRLPGYPDSLFFLLYAACLAGKQQILFFSLWLDLIKDQTHDLPVTILHGSKIQLNGGVSDCCLTPSQQ